MSPYSQAKNPIHRLTRMTRREALQLTLAAAGAACFVPSSLVAAMTQEASQAAAERDAEATSLPNELVLNYMKTFKVPGLSVAFARGKQMLAVHGYGEANKEDHAPVTPASLFRIASDSKAFTSTAIFKLIEAGKLNLQDHVFAPNGILPQFSNIGPHRDWIHAITVHQLLTHTEGGWSNENNDPMFEMRGLNHEQLIAQTLRTHPLQFPPGANYAYSNFGYCVLGRVIERISGQPYAQFVHQQVLAPCGIHDMRIATQKPAPDEVHYYGQNGENPYNFPIARMDSHGGWIATPTDLVLFITHLFAPEDHSGVSPLISQESLRVMTTGTSANKWYGCGWALNAAGNCWHVGSLPGTLCIMVHTKTGMSWAGVLNSRSSNPRMEPQLDDLMWKIAGTKPQWHA